MEQSKMIKVRAAAHFSSSQFGTFTPGEFLMLPEDIANRYAQSGLVTLENYESKPHVYKAPNPPVAAVKDTPKTEATDLGGDEPSTLSQPVQALRKETATTFKRGRRRKADES